MWPKLSVETRAAVKRVLFECLEQESASNVRDLISDAIGEIGGSLLSEESTAQEWAELLQQCWQLFSQESAKYVMAGFRILQNLLMFASDSFAKHAQELHTLFLNGLKSAEPGVK